MCVIIYNLRTLSDLCYLVLLVHSNTVPLDIGLYYLCNILQLAYSFMVLYYLALVVHSTTVSLDIVLYYLCNILQLATLSGFYTTLYTLPQFLWTLSYTTCVIFYSLRDLSGFYTTLCSLCILPQFLWTLSYTTCVIFYNLRTLSGFLYYLVLLVHSTTASFGHCLTLFV